MTDWGRVKQDVLAGAASLTTRASRAARRTGRELAFMESRAELMRIERELARRYQGFGEAAYEEWRREGALALRTPALREYRDAISGLAAQRDRLRRELSESDVFSRDPRE